MSVSVCVGCAQARGGELAVRHGCGIPAACPSSLALAPSPMLAARWPAWPGLDAEAVRLALDGGATVVQLREKRLEGGAFLAEAAEVAAVCRCRGVPLVVNDRVDVALALGGGGAWGGDAGDVGVHVGQVRCCCCCCWRGVRWEIVAVSCATVKFRGAPEPRAVC